MIIRPLKNWFTLKRTYRHGDKTFYSDRHLGSDLLCPEGVSVFAPADGEIIVSDSFPQGGQTIHFKFTYNNQIYVMRCLHLSERMPLGGYRMGEKIGKTGNSGLSTAPHLHIDMSHNKVDLKDFNNFIDPETFFMLNIKVQTINFPKETQENFKSEVSRLSNKQIGIEIENFDLAFTPPGVGMLTMDEAYALADTIPHQFLFIGYPKNATSSFFATFYYPKKDSMITTCPLPNAERLLAFEFGHQIQTFVNAHRCP